MFFFAVVFLFVVFLVGLLTKENVGISPRTDWAGILGLALAPVELFLEVRLRIGSPPEGTHGNLEFTAAKCADSDCRGGAQPLQDPKAALDHGHFFLRIWHSALLGYRRVNLTAAASLPAHGFAAFPNDERNNR